MRPKAFLLLVCTVAASAGVSMSEAGGQPLRMSDDARQRTGAASAAACRPKTKRSQVKLVAGASGADRAPRLGLLGALMLVNRGRRSAAATVITSVATPKARTASPKLPLRLGTIRAHRAATLTLRFAGTFLPRRTYPVVVRGRYRVRTRRYCFSVRGLLRIPPRSPGTARLTSRSIAAHSVRSGEFPHQKLEFDDDVNPELWLVPTASRSPERRTAPGTAATAAPRNPGAPYLSTLIPSLVPLAGQVVFNRISSLGLTSGNTNGTASSTAEPSGASGGGVIFVSANWTAAYSTDGGVTYRQLDPTTIFPNDAVGYCCDQIVQYVPSIDRFVWLLQGNGYRLAVARPADIINSGGTAWTYWNLTPGLFGQPAGTGFDYPDLSVGNRQLYLSWDAGSQCPARCTSGFQVARTSLAGLQAGGTITIEFTNPADGQMAWGSHVSQDTGDEVFWAGHNSNQSLRVFSLREGSGSYFWRDRGVGTWANNAPTSTTPDGQDWLAKNFNGPNGNSFPRNGVIGATRSSGRVWFAWSAGTDRTFRQAHIELVQFDPSNNFARLQQVQIWNSSYAFAYPALSTNICTGEIGLSFEFGGGGNYENHVVGFWGDFIAWITTASDVGSTRFGDYVTIRQLPLSRTNFGNLFVAFGYGLNRAAPPATGTTTDVRYVLFGRPAGTCAPG